MCVSDRQPILQVHQYCDAQLPQQFAVPCACHSPDATHLERFGFTAREARRRPTARAVEASSRGNETVHTCEDMLEQAV